MFDLCHKGFHCSVLMLFPTRERHLKFLCETKLYTYYSVRMCWYWKALLTFLVTFQKLPQTALNFGIITWAFHYFVLIFRLPIQHFQCTGAELCWDVLIYFLDMWPSRPRTDSEFCSPFQSAAGQRNLTFTMHFPCVWKTDWKCELRKVQESV